MPTAKGPLRLPSPLPLASPLPALSSYLPPYFPSFRSPFFPLLFYHLLPSFSFLPLTSPPLFLLPFPAWYLPPSSLSLSFPSPHSLNPFLCVTIISLPPSFHFASWLPFRHCCFLPPRPCNSFLSFLCLYAFPLHSCPFPPGSFIPSPPVTPSLLIPFPPLLTSLSPASSHRMSKKEARRGVIASLESLKGNRCFSLFRATMNHATGFIASGRREDRE